MSVKGAIAFGSDIEDDDPLPVILQGTLMFWLQLYAYVYVYKWYIVYVCVHEKHIKPKQHPFALCVFYLGIAVALCVFYVHTRSTYVKFAKYDVETRSFFYTLQWTIVLSVYAVIISLLQFVVANLKYHKWSIIIDQWNQ